MEKGKGLVNRLRRKFHCSVLTESVRGIRLKMFRVLDLSAARC